VGVALDERKAMPLAAFTFGDATLTIVELAFMFLWIWIAIGVVFDVFRSPDLSNWSKALWVLFIFVFPLVGVLGYLIIRGHTMHEHQLRDRTQYEAFQQFKREGASHGSADDLSKLAELRDRGVLTGEEFDRAKSRALG
jgi:Short C-terminal domain/Phospholipase_D-nuclease N-terminal